MVSAVMLKAEKLEPACPKEFHNLISLLFVFYGLEDMLEDSVKLSLAEFKNKWKQTLGDEFTGKNSKARFKLMKVMMRHRTGSSLQQPSMA